MNGPSIWQRRVADPVKALLLQGVTPERIALSMSVGAVVGVFPVLGTTTVLCTVVALACRLNLVAIQIVNWVVYPLQIALLIPFFRAGEWLFRAPPLSLTPPQLVTMFRDDFRGSIVALWDTTWHAAVAWMAIALPLTLALHLLLRALLLAVARRRTSVAVAQPT